MVVSSDKALNRSIKFTEFFNRYENLSMSMISDIENQDFIVGVWQKRLAETIKPWIKIKAAGKIVFHTAKKANYIARKALADSKKNYYNTLRGKESVKHLDLTNERMGVLEKINAIESGIE